MLFDGAEARAGVSQNEYTFRFLFWVQLAKKEGVFQKNDPPLTYLNDWTYKMGWGQIWYCDPPDFSLTGQWVRGKK